MLNSVEAVQVSDTTHAEQRLNAGANNIFLFVKVFES